MKLKYKSHETPFYMLLKVVSLLLRTLSDGFCSAYSVILLFRVMQAEYKKYLLCLYKEINNKKIFVTKGKYKASCYYLISLNNNKMLCTYLL